MTKIRVLLADDHAILRAGLRMLLAAQPDMTVVAEAADGEEAVRRALATRPDVAVIDLTMPGLSGVETLGRLRREVPATRLLVLTMHDDPGYARVALAAGASGHVVKDAESAELLTAIRTVHRGRTFVPYPGNPVLATVHTNDAAQAVDRILDAFPAGQVQQARVQLAACLAGVIYQQLVPAVGGGRVAAFEILIANSAVRSLIKEGKTNQIRNIMQTSLREGSQTLERSLGVLLQSGLVTERDARARSLYPQELGRT